jgi:ATP-binding cassette subfamily C protein
VRFGVAALRRRPLLALAAWSVPEALPAALYGIAIARAVDSGFLAGRPLVGLAWLAGLVAAAGAGAVGARQIFRRLGDLVEPFRDDLVRRVVGGALRNGIAGRPDDGAVARLTRQVEIVRDTYAGLIVVVRGFAVAVIGAVVGMLSLAPVIVVLVLPPFLLGVAAFLATLGMAAARYRASVRADERLAATAGAVLAGLRDVVARGAEEHAARMVAGPIGEQAAAEYATARVAALRAVCFAVGGWLPLVILLAAGPWLVARGLTVGAIMGGLTYVLFGLQPALNTLISGLGGSGLRFVVTLGRILDASAPPTVTAARTAAGAAGGVGPPGGAGAAGAAGATGAGGGLARERRPAPGAGTADLTLQAVTFAYGRHAEPVLRDLTLTVPEGDHLVIVGPSGIGKSTLAGLLCGLLRPTAGEVLLGGAPVAGLATHRLAAARVLIPQEAYVFTGTTWDNLTYLRPASTTTQVRAAVVAIGAEALVARLGGLRADLRPQDLSAGERQLLALVRAYLCAAPVAVLDEATCHLDPAAERRAEEAFADRGRTVIVIAHRASSALRARRVLVLDGTTALAGSHDAMLARSALYRDLIGLWYPDQAPDTHLPPSAAAGPSRAGTPVGGRLASRLPTGGPAAGGLNPEGHSQPASSAIRAASNRLRAPVLRRIEDR